MRHRSALVWLLAAAWVPAAWAQADAQQAERAAQRRAQLQMQAMQQQLQQAQAAKSQADSERDTATKAAEAQARALARARAALREMQAERDALKAERAQLVARVAALERTVAETQRAGEAAMAAKEREVDFLVRLVETNDRDANGRFDRQTTVLGECAVKNDRLVALSRELVQRYRDKSVVDVVQQREPLLGLGEVRLFEREQDWRDRTDAERFKPLPAGAAPAPAGPPR